MSAAQEPFDLVDRIAGLAPGGATHALRHQREKVALATQGSYDAVLDPVLDGLPLAHRLLVALYACRLTPNDALAAHYRQRLEDGGADASWVRTVAQGTPEDIDTLPDAALRAALRFTRVLIERPVDGDKALLQTLPAAGLSSPAVVALSQLVAFLSYQTRLVAGLRAIEAFNAEAAS